MGSGCVKDGSIRRPSYLRGPASAQARPGPRLAKLHRELRRSGVTLMLLWQKLSYEVMPFTDNSMCPCHRSSNNAAVHKLIARYDLPTRFSEEP